MIPILNIDNVRTEPMSSLLGFCDERLRTKQGATLVPLNPIKVIKARQRPDFQEMIQQADWVFADAWGIKWAANLLHNFDIEVCPGWQTMLALIEHAANNEQTVYLLGTTSEILKAACDELSARYPNVRIIGSHHGFFSQAEEEVLFNEIARLGPDYVFVAMGEYKQEIVIEKLRAVHPSAVYQGVGGSLDLLVGRQPMPPKWMRDRHLEWLFRAIRQPFRLPRFRALPVFVVLVLLRRLCGRPKTAA